MDEVNQQPSHLQKYPLPPATQYTEWNYEMRREMQEVIPGLFLGPYSAAKKAKCDTLREHNITHIICIRHQLEAHFIKPNFPRLFKYLVLDIADSLSESIIQHFPNVKQFLEECFHAGGKALIHGNAGISRSAALVIGYIMEKYGLTYREAFLLVQQRRFCISPNERFAQQLQDYEPIYRARFSTLNSENYLNLSNAQKFKRSFEEAEDMFMNT